MLCFVVINCVLFTLLTFYVFGTCFRPLVVILVLDLFQLLFYILCSMQMCWTMGMYLALVTRYTSISFSFLSLSVCVGGGGGREGCFVV